MNRKMDSRITDTMRFALEFECIPGVQHGAFYTRESCHAQGAITLLPRNGFFTEEKYSLYDEHMSRISLQA